MNSSRLDSARTEIEIMKICKFPYIIKFIEEYETIDYIYIFMEYCSGGTLYNYIKKRNFEIKEEIAAKIIYKICLTTNYFHSYGITHRDLKPENVLMTSKDDDADIRILDFGLGKIIGPSEKCREPYGTILYVAPEIILKKPYSKNVDSWSIGIIAYILLYGKLPFYDNSKSTLKRIIIENQPKYKSSSLKNISNESKNFIQNLLIKDPDKRMTLSQALEHKWFKKYIKNTPIDITTNNLFNINEIFNRLNLARGTNSKNNP
jgi:calcium-dependent protein kinase